MPYLLFARDAARADLCRFLAACYYEPGREFSEEALFDSMFTAAAALDEGLASCAKRVGDSFRAHSLDDLLVDYTRLFLGPTDILAKPYGSSWLTGEKTLMQDATMAVLELYREAGFEMDETFRELPDHIAAELEFLYVLIHRTAAMQCMGNAAAIAALESLRRRLLSEHLGRWVEPFTAAIEQSAGTSFYRNVAQATRRLVAAEMDTAA